MRTLATLALLATTFVTATGSARAATRSYDCGLVTGLQKAALVNSATPAAWGNVKVMSALWKLRAERLIELAQALTDSAPQVDSSDVGLVLSSLANSLTSFEGGSGDVDYWVEKNRQLGQLELTTLDSLTALRTRVCQ